MKGRSPNLPSPPFLLSPPAQQALASLPPSALSRAAGGGGGAGLPSFDAVALVLGPTGSVASLLPNAKASARA